MMVSEAPTTLDSFIDWDDVPLLDEALLDEALQYAQRGWSVFPVYEAASIGVCSCPKGTTCSSVGKHPRIQRGFKAATTDEAVVRDWWSKWPNANIGIATGEKSGLLVVDVDPRHDGDISLGELESQHGKLPNTVESLTGGGGRHVLFKYPQGMVVKMRKSVGSGLDIKGV